VSVEANGAPSARADYAADNYRARRRTISISVVLAALDNSLAANPVLVTARAVARVLGARVEAVHVFTEGDRAAQHAADAAGVPLRVCSGEVVQRLVEAGHDPEVAAVVVGARGSTGTGRPLGSTALAVVTSVQRPVVVVPSNALVAAAMRRVLVPLEGTISTSLAPRSIIELAAEAALEITVLHVDEDGEGSLQAEDFLGRYCPWGIGSVRLERRAGKREELVPLVAEELQSDLIVFGWAQQLAEGRAPVVRAALERSTIPVMLIPVSVEGGDDERA
jgi:nucleotide-binding universal stress UspA family protein